MRQAAEWPIWMHTDPQLWACVPAQGSPAADQVVLPPGVSGVGLRPLIGVHAHWGSLSLCAQAAGPLITVCPPGVSVVGAQSANLGASNQASGESWGCLSSVHCQGAEGGGAPEAEAAAKSSLTSR